MTNQFIIILPEILLASLAICMQIIAVFNKSHVRKVALTTVFIGLGIVCYLLSNTPKYELGFGASFATSKFIALFKAIILIFALLSIVVYRDFTKIKKNKLKFEFVTLILLSTVGVFISISARDFMLLFCGLELQALSGYALAAFNTKNSKSSEAGLKYFILGALMSCIMLLGISFFYGFSGSIKFFEIKETISSSNIGLVVGSVLVISTILFKLSAAPMHIWTPDVYEGSPITAVTYFSVAQKVGMLIVLLNITDDVISHCPQVANQLIKLVAILSMLVGSLGAIRQSSLKRLMAYSSILNVGYVLVGVSLPAQEGNYAALSFMLIYAISVMGFFAALIALLGAKSEEATFNDLSGLAAKHKILAASISIIMFSMIGLPPLAGFFGKYYIFYNAIKQGEIMLAITGVLTSVIAAFYYLKIVKYMYFIESDKEHERVPCKMGLSLVITLSLAFILLFFIFAQKYIL